MKSILFHCAGGLIGDSLIKLPAILALKARCPDIKLTLSIRRGRTAFSAGLAPLVDGVIDEILESSEFGTRWTQTLKAPRDRFFDTIIASVTKCKDTLALKRIAHTTFIAPWSDFRLSDCRPSVSFLDLPVYRQTQSLFELAIGEAIDLADTLQLPESYLTAAAEILPAGPSYVGFSPGAGKKIKCWPLANFIQTARTQISSGRVPVFFLGPEEEHWLPELREAVPEGLFPEYMYTDRSLKGPLFTIALARQIPVSVANDAGGGHLLAAGGRTLISLFGDTDPRKFEPPFGHRRVLSASEFNGKTVGQIPVSAVEKALDEIFP